MKRIIVFGASGRTGRMVVKYGLEAGYHITAFDSGHHHILTPQSGLDLHTGNVYDKEAVIKLIEGHDAVISTLGTSDIHTDAVNLMSDAMKIFTEAMNKYGIKRVLAVGGLAVLQLNESMQMIDKADYPTEYKN
ncbi:MAG TPA: NAD(P)H-binding protein, partial [Chitinophagales bacterium]|nr:NAD(P)H-binding protein [Chitinophagales bacterium]